jgi:hypothetical protein
MSYLGTPPQSGFITTAKQRVTSSTNAYVDLDHAISSIADVIVFVNFVKQDTTNLTLTTSTRITLGATLVSSDIVEIHYLGKAVNTQTPGTATVTNDMLAGSIANSKLANSSITLNGSAVSLGGSATVGQGNEGAFYVYKNSLSVANATSTVITGWSESFDLDNWFASDKYTPQSAGKYVFFYTARANNIGVTSRFIVTLRKNGSGLAYSAGELNIVSASYPTAQQSFIVDMNGSSDYIELEIFHNLGSSGNFFDMFLQGFKLA